MVSFSHNNSHKIYIFIDSIKKRFKKTRKTTTKISLSELLLLLN